MTKFFVVGDVTVDQMYFVNDLPDAGGEVTASRAVLEPGGAGGTLAVALARLGNDVLLAARVGSGPFAELALKHVKRAGVDTRLVQTDPVLQTSSVTLLITPDTQRTMISGGGATRSGTSSVNVAPSPGTLAPRTQPPIRSASLVLMARPRPVPP